MWVDPRIRPHKVSTFDNLIDIIRNPYAPIYVQAGFLSTGC